jgi:hypothetical protein
MALALRCGEVVQVSAIHRLRDIWAEIVEHRQEYCAAGAEAPVALMEAHMNKRASRGSRLSVASSGRDSVASIAEEGGEAAPATEEEVSEPATPLSRTSSLRAPPRGSCSVVSALLRARARHSRSRRHSAPGAESAPPEVDASLTTITFVDLLRVVHPRASAAELAALEAAAPPRVPREQLAASRAATRAMVQAQRAAEARALELDALLASADADGSGELDLGEFCELMTQLGVTARDEQLELFEQADADASGAISVAEFRSFWLERS